MDVNHIKHNEDFVKIGVDYLPQHYRQQEDFVKIVEIFSERFKALDKIICDSSEATLVKNSTEGYPLELLAEEYKLNKSSSKTDVLAKVYRQGMCTTRSEVITYLEYLYGVGKVTTYKGNGNTFEVHINSECFDPVDVDKLILPALADMTNLRVISGKPFEWLGKKFGFRGDDDALGFSISYNRGHPDAGYLLTAGLSGNTNEADLVASFFGFNGDETCLGFSASNKRTSGGALGARMYTDSSIL